MPSGAFDIFGYQRNPKPKAVFSSEDFLLTFGSASGGNDSNQDAAGLLVQSWNIAYQQQVQEIFELGSHNIYWVKGRPSGGGALGRVVGPKSASGGARLFPAEAYNICAGGVTASLKVGSKICGVQSDNVQAEVDNSFRLKLDGLVVNNIGFSTDVANTRIMEAINFRFSFLDIEEGGNTVL